MGEEAVATSPFLLKKGRGMEYRIIWKNTATKEVTVQTAEDTGGNLFYTFRVPEGLGKGEYEYYITSAEGTLDLHDNDVRLSTIDGEKITVYDCGVAQVGEIARRDTSTYNVSKEYEQYEN